MSHCIASHHRLRNGRPTLNADVAVSSSTICNLSGDCIDVEVLSYFSINFKQNFHIVHREHSTSSHLVINIVPLYHSYAKL